MLPIELDSINRGLIYGEKKYSSFTYIGYFNADGQIEGAGVLTHDDEEKSSGEYRSGNLNGIGKYEFPNGPTYWGEWKDNEREGYGTEYYPDNGQTYTGQFKNDRRDGYGHSKWESGSIHYGQWKEEKMEGYGYYKWAFGDEYDGEFKNGKRAGVGVHKWGASGTIKRCNWKNNEIINVIKVIKH